MSWEFTSHLFAIEGEEIRCKLCGRSYKKKPATDHCPGIMMYGWGKWPSHLLTKKQLNDAGYSVAASALPKPAGACWREESPDGLMLLYDRNCATPKRVLSEAAKQSRAAATVKIAEKWRCQRCGQRVEKNRYGAGFCYDCGEHNGSRDWSIEKLGNRDQWVGLDSETSGLERGYNEIVELAIVDGYGRPLLDTRIKPMHPERLLEVSGRCSACDINGIHPDMLKDAPTFAEVYPKIQAIIRDKHVLIYNEEFDHGMLDGDCKRYKLPKLEAKGWECVMLEYAAWVGERRYERRSRGYYTYRWQPLNGGHSALSDCLATIKRIEEMAKE